MNGEMKSLTINKCKTNNLNTAMNFQSPSNIKIYENPFLVYILKKFNRSPENEASPLVEKNIPQIKENEVSTSTDKKIECSDHKISNQEIIIIHKK